MVDVNFSNSSENVFRIKPGFALFLRYVILFVGNQNHEYILFYFKNKHYLL